MQMKYYSARHCDLMVFTLVTLRVNVAKINVSVHKFGIQINARLYISSHTRAG